MLGTQSLLWEELKSQTLTSAKTFKIANSQTLISANISSFTVYRLPLKVSLDPLFIGLTYTGTIRLLYLEGDSQTKKRNPYVHRLALHVPTCPARLLIEM